MGNDIWRAEVYVDPAQTHCALYRLCGDAWNRGFDVIGSRTNIGSNLYQTILIPFERSFKAESN